MLILDDRRGRKVAAHLGLRFVGVIAILGELATRGHLDFDKTMEALLETGFRVSAAVIEEVRRRSREA